MDYYRHTAFEFIRVQLGALGTVLGGGRYDGLIGDMGGPETPAVGWAAGVERLAMLVGDVGGREFSYVVTSETEGLDSDVVQLSTLLRRNQIVSEFLLDGSLKKRVKKAQSLDAYAVFVLRQSPAGAPKGFYIDVKLGRRSDISEYQIIEQEIIGRMKQIGSVQLPAQQQTSNYDFVLFAK